MTQQQLLQIIFRQLVYTFNIAVFNPFVTYIQHYITILL